MKLELPLWKGIKSESCSVDPREFSLCVSENGYIIQNTSPEILEEVFKGYSDDNYNYITTAPGQSAFIDKNTQSRVKKIFNMTGSLDGKVILDIGAGNDYVAKKIESTFNIDKYVIVDPSIREKSNSNKIELIRDYFSTESVVNIEPDLIICLSCLEHVPNAFEFLSEIRLKLSKPSSKAILFFPLVEDQFKSGDINAILHEHISYFTTDTVLSTFKKIGLNIIKSDKVNDGGWFYIEKCESKEIDMALITTSQKDLIDNYGSKIKSKLGRFKQLITQSENKNIVLFGACNGLNSLIYSSAIDLSNYNISLVDSDDKKIDKYIPAFNRQIKHKSDFEFKYANLIIISAHSFFDEIKNDLIDNHKIDSNIITSIY
jgi:hypothetical protein